MMARSHALSAAAGWLALAAGSAAAGYPWTWPTVTIGGIVCAGSALLPDIDTPHSHAARSLGPVTGLLARGVAAASHRLYTATATPLDVSDDGRRGHRGLTHTIPFAVVLGAVVTGLTFTPAGRGTVAAVLFFAATLAARGLLPWDARHAPIGSGRWRIRFEWAPVTGLAAAWVLLHFTPDATAWAWLGVPVALGAVLHDLGDAPTHRAGWPPETSGIPLLWPFVVRGQRWYRVRPPAAVMFPVGGVLERACAVAFALVAVVSAYALLASAG